jgi:hyperosmotically inducible periplasmic protein
MHIIMNRTMRAAIAVALVCGTVACATGPRKSEAQQQADNETANRVQLALNTDKVLYARHITIRADNGVVVLGGYVWTQPELLEAIRIASDVPGVAKVVDRIEIDRGDISDSSVSR